MARGGCLIRPARRSGVAAALAAALLVGVVAGCGGDDESVAPEAYVGDVCGALADLTATVREGQGEINEALSTPEEGRDALTRFLGDAASAAGAAEDSVDDAGVPDVDDGEEVASTVTGAISDLRGVFEQAEGEAEQMSTDSERAFTADAREITSSLQESSQQIQDSLAALDGNEELEGAAEDVEACQQI